MRFINHLGYKSVMILILFIFFVFGTLQPVFAQDERQNNPILIISSYNPETYQTSQNISAFLDEYKRLGGDSPVVIENMNCKSFSEAPLWKDHMANILLKYTGTKTPQVIVLLGQEAWTSYISQEDLKHRNIPILGGMVSRNAIILPEDTVDLENWEPESLDVKTGYKYYSHISGFAYNYDVEKNIRLILELYPDTKHLAFISDNSYGGVSMQAYIKKEIRKFPNLNLILLDGRKHTIYTIVDNIATLPEKTVLLVGTWRVDKNDGYFMRNATYSMMSANPMLPAFTLSSVGLGHWVIGGYMPQYRTIGKDLARQTIEMTKLGEKVLSELEDIPNQYSFDYQKLQFFGLTNYKLPENSILINKEITFFERYRYQIIGIVGVFVFLVLALVTIFLYYLRTKRLKDQLLLSEVELIAAKDKAEESDRLKSAFLANMSHEIRTPLNAIVGFSNVLTTGDCSPEEQKQFVEVIQTNSDLLLRLIGDILDIARLETGKLRFTNEECDVVNLCQKVLATTSYLKGAEVEYKFSCPYESYLLTADVQRLQQVLINLLSNASKFTKKGRVTLEFGEDIKQDFVVFKVMDTGCGIPPEKQEKVFERFEKLDEYAQGTGLGLAICRLTVERWGGQIWVDKNYREGACFVFTHPTHRQAIL